jgi:hypothetical protein
LLRQDHRDDLEYDFHLGALDAIISFSDLSPRPEGVVTLSQPLPYIVVMIPNVGREANYLGQLTTSLYYRLGRDQIDLCFDGDRVEWINRLVESRGDTVGDRSARLFAYDPERGSSLFGHMTYPSKRIVLHSGNPALEGTVHYLADVISRDRSQVVLSDSRKEGDVHLEFVPISATVPSTTIYNLFYQLAADTLAERTANEHVRRIAAELRYVESPRQPDDYYRHLEIAGRIMIEDLGVFPLFRPTLFLHHHKHLQGVAITDDGAFDLSRAYLIRLPGAATKGER